MVGKSSQRIALPIGEALCVVGAGDRMADPSQSSFSRSFGDRNIEIALIFRPFPQSGPGLKIETLLIYLRFFLVFIFPAAFG